MFKDKAAYSYEIEKLAAELNLPFIEAVCEYCQINGLEVEKIGKQLTPNLRKKIESEASDLNMLKYKIKRLPLSE